MKILNFSLDKKILEPKSAAAKRVIGYGERLDNLRILVPAGQDTAVEPHDKLGIYGIGGNKLLVFFKIYFLAGNLIRQDRPDVITVQDQYYLAGLAWWLSKRFKVAWEIQVHGFEKMAGFRARLFQFIVRRADSVRTVSERFKRILVNEYGVKEKLVTVVPVSVARNVKRETLKGKKDCFIFLGVGRLVPVKRFDVLIKAFARIKDNVDGAELWIAGEGEERGELERIINEEELGESVKLLGWQDDLGPIYEQAAGFVLSSDAEGYGLAVIEAMQHGLPVVMTDVGLADEIVINEESGLVVPVNDIPALAQAMQRIYDSSELREKLVQGSKQALTKLPDEEETWDLYVQSWEKAMR